jgi:hypothetical protein
VKRRVTDGGEWRLTPSVTKPKRGEGSRRGGRLMRGNRGGVRWLSSTH